MSLLASIIIVFASTAWHINPATFGGTSAFAINVEGDFAGMDSDGFTLKRTTANATAGDIHYIALRIS